MPAGSAKKVGRRRLTGDTFVKIIFGAAAVVVVGILLSLGYELYMGSRMSMAAFGLQFLTGTDWDPVHSIFGAAPYIYGTLVTSATALLIGFPISLGVAIFLSEMAKGSRILGSVLGTLVELLAAVPSVIYGLWGLFVLVPFIRTYVETPLHSSLGFIPLFSGAPSGLDYLSAGIILAIMIIPTISAVSRDIINAVPNSQREAMYSLGATRWEVTRRAVLPYAKSGIFGATILGLGRAVGETMAVIMVIGNTPTITADLFAGGYTLSGVIANQFTVATDPLWTSAVVEVGLILFGLALTINVLARTLIWRMTKGTKFRV
jgi:phosphate transport system permease protein